MYNKVLNNNNYKEYTQKISIQMLVFNVKFYFSDMKLMICLSVWIIEWVAIGYF